VAGVGKLMGKSKERIKWKPQAEIKLGVVIGSVGTATFLK
jgi:hypothetical protein